MNTPVKYRTHIEKVWRMPPDHRTRLDKHRLDKNERIELFHKDFWHDLVIELTQEAVQAYPEVWPLYEQLAAHHGLTPGNFLLTAGSDAAIRHCFETFVSAGDKVIYPDPTFAMVPIYCDLFGAEKVPISYDNNLTLDTSSLLNRIDEKTALVVLANPNSPTGTAVSEAIVAQILSKAAALKIPVMIDEAYYGFCTITAEPMLSKFDNLIITRSFSKVAGLAGLRVGYLIADTDVIGLLTRFRPMYEINAFGALFARKVLLSWNDVMDYGRRTVEGRDRLVQAFRECGLAVVNTETNFIHVNFGSARESILCALEENNILVRGMLSVAGYEGFTRMSVGPWEVMAPALEIIIRVLSAGTIIKE